MPFPAAEQGCSPVQWMAQPLIFSSSSTGSARQLSFLSTHPAVVLSTHLAVHVKAATFLKAGLEVKLAWDCVPAAALLFATYRSNFMQLAVACLPTLLLTISDTTLSCMTWREGESVKCFRFQEPMRATTPGAHGHESAGLLYAPCCCLVRSAS